MEYYLKCESCGIADGTVEEEEACFPMPYYRSIAAADERHKRDNMPPALLCSLCNWLKVSSKNSKDNSSKNSKEDLDKNSKEDSKEDLSKNSKEDSNGN